MATKAEPTYARRVKNALRSYLIRNSMYSHPIKCDALFAVAGHEFALLVGVGYNALILLLLCDKSIVYPAALKESMKTLAAEYNVSST